MTGFFSLLPFGVWGVSGPGVISERDRKSGCSPSENVDLGVMASMGFIVAVEESLPKRDGYISSGVERRDSVGEFSNLMADTGVWADQESILTGVWAVHHTRRTCDCVLWLVG